MKSKLIITIAIFLYYSNMANTQNLTTDNSKLHNEIAQLQVEEDKDISYEEADKALNKVYQQLLKKYEKAPIFLKKLKIAQRLWIKFRDAELEMRFPLDNKRVNYGSVYFGCAEKLLIDMTVERTNTLKEWLLDVDEYDGCNGSKGVFNEKEY